MLARRERERSRSCVAHAVDSASICNSPARRRTGWQAAATSAPTIDSQSASTPAARAALPPDCRPPVRGPAGRSGVPLPTALVEQLVHGGPERHRVTGRPLLLPL